MKNIKLLFKGYWREEKRKYIPHIGGIYLVYRCVYDPESDTVSLSDLVYIGQSVDVNQRIAQHFKEGTFDGVAQDNETLCFSVAEVPAGDLDLVENALIFAQQPVLNNVGKENYNHESASFSIEGRCGLLQYTCFTISNPD